MSVSKTQAMNAAHFHMLRMNGDVPCMRYRRNGRTQTWKRDPSRFRTPVVYGLRGYAQLTEVNAHEFHVPEECPLAEPQTAATGRGRAGMASVRGSIPRAATVPDGLAMAGTSHHPYRGRARGFSSAAASRELWRGFRAMSTGKLQGEYRTHRFCLSVYAGPMRSGNLRNVDTWYVRVIASELSRRGEHVHRYTCLVAIPDRMAGAVTGYTEMVECACGDRMAR